MLTTNSSKFNQHGNCGFQICPHPACWEATKRLHRELLYKSCYGLPVQKRSDEEVFVRDIASLKDITEEIPTLSILNLSEENEDHQSCSRSTTPSKQSNIFQSFPNLPSHDSEILSKLQLKSITQDSASGVTPAPANTPLHSCHRMEDMADRKSGASTDEMSTLPKQASGNAKPNPPPIHNMKLNFQHGKKKRILMWKSRHKQAMNRHDGDAKAKSSGKVASNLILPLESLPAQAMDTSWKSTKAKRSLKPLHFTNFPAPMDTSRNYDAPTEAKNKKVASGDAPSQIPREIERLRLVPLDVLLRVVKLALRNRVLTIDQADVLLYQITGQKYTFVKEDKKSTPTLNKTTLYLAAQKKVPVHTTRASKRTSTFHPSSNPIVYKLDSAQSETEKIIQKKQKREESRNSSRHQMMSLDDIFLHSNDVRIPRVPLPKLPASAIKTTVGCVVRAADEAAMPSSTKPFHYQKGSYDMCLHPLPTPPASSPATERDSKYNEILGGSTVLANPSSIHSITTFERPFSGGSYKSARRRTSLTNTGVDAKTSSSTKSTVWPQVDEVFIFENDAENLTLLDPCPPSVEIVQSEVDEAKLPALTEGSSDTQRTIESSPVPPPPSPVVPHGKEPKMPGGTKELELT